MKSTLQLMLTSYLLLMTSYFLNAQVGINEDGSNADASAMLDVKSTDKGILIPRMTTTQRTDINSPATGLLVFDITTETFWFKNATSWVELKDGTTPATLADTDNDTKIQVEESADEDTIRFDIGGVEYFKFIDKGRMEFENTFGNIFIGKDAGANEDYTPIFGNTKSNIAVGDSSLALNTSGQYNTAIGVSTMKSNTTGSYNTVFGAFALENSIMGINNTAIGAGALYSNKGGNANTVIGSGAMSNNIGGSTNVAIGQSAGAFSTSSANVFIGAYAGAQKTVGFANVMIGHGAGELNGGTKNIFIGYEAGRNETGNNKLYIDNSSTSSPLIYGEFNSNLIRINGTLNINNAFSFPKVDGTNGQVLQTDGSGSLSWVALTDSDNQELSLSNDILSIANGTSNIDLSAYANSNTILIQDADNDTKIQVEESADEDIIRFDIEGTEKLTLQKSITGRPRMEFLDNSNSIYIGKGAGDKDNGTATNIAIGDSAFIENTSGIYNLAIGYKTLKNNTSGNANTAIGAYSTLEDNTTGSNNVAFGSLAGYRNTTGEHNILIGGVAGGGNQNGDNNVLIGHQAGAGSSSLTGHDKHNNVMIGYLAGGANQGDANVFLGYRAGGGELGSNKLYIENSNSSTPLIYGEFDNDLVRINGNLEVTGSFPTSTLLSDTDNDTKIQVEESADEDAIRFDIEGTEYFRMDKYQFIASNSNIAFGNHNTLQFLTTGTDNIALGVAALSGDSTGSNNIALGFGAGQFNGTGSNNLFLGYQAGGASFSVNNSILIGYQAGYLETNSNRLYIENSSSVSPLIYGEFDNDLLRVNGTLNINNAFSFPTTDGTNGQVLQTDGSGTLSWSTATDNDNQDLSLSNDILSITNGVSNIDLSAYANSNVALVQDTDNDTKVQVEKNNDDDIIRFDLEGNEQFIMEDSKLTIKAVTLSSNPIDLVFNNNTVSGGSTAKNEINNVLPWGFNISDEDYKMNFKINGNTALTLKGDKAVRVSDSYDLPTDNGNMGEVLVTDGAGNTAWTTLNTTDNLGNHQATQNIRLNNKYLSNDGGNEGVSIDNSGNTTVSGTLKVGGTSAISGFLKASIARDVSNISSNSTRVETFTVTGAAVGNVVYVSPRADIGGRLVIGQVWVSAANTVSVRFRNVGGSGQNPPNTTYDFVVIQ